MSEKIVPKVGDYVVMWVDITSPNISWCPVDSKMGHAWRRDRFRIVDLATDGPRVRVSLQGTVLHKADFAHQWNGEPTYLMSISNPISHGIEFISGKRKKCRQCR